MQPRVALWRAQDTCKKRNYKHHQEQKSPCSHWPLLPLHSHRNVLKRETQRWVEEPAGLKASSPVLGQRVPGAREQGGCPEVWNGIRITPTCMTCQDSLGKKQGQREEGSWTFWETSLRVRRTGRPPAEGWRAELHEQHLAQSGSKIL